MPKRLVSLDIGNVNTRGVSSNKTVLFPSVSAFEQGTLNFSGFENNPDYLVITLGDERVALGEAAFKLGRLPVSDMGRHRLDGNAYRRLIAGALVSVVGRSSDLVVVASLPVQHYTGAREDMRRTLSGDYYVGAGDKQLHFHIDPRDLHIIPEGFGALCSLILDRDGVVRNGDPADMRVGVIDAGGRTTDYLFFDHLELVPVLSQGVDKAGMSALWKLLDEQIQQKYGRTLNLRELDETLHNGYFMKGPERVFVNDEVDTAAAALADSIMATINSEWDGGDAAELLIFVGGGSEFVFDYMPYAHKVLVTKEHHGVETHMANVVGGYRFGLFRGFHA